MIKKKPLAVSGIMAVLCFCLMFMGAPVAGSNKIKLCRNDTKGHLKILIDGQLALEYQYSGTGDLPHLWPVNSPTG